MIDCISEHFVPRTKFRRKNHFTNVEIPYKKKYFQINNLSQTQTEVH